MTWIFLIGIAIGMLSDHVDCISFPRTPLVGGHVIYASLDALAIVQLRKAINSVAHGIEVAEGEWWAALVVLIALRDFVCIVRNNTLHGHC
jgi:hypothetical protein